jgi:hypothetical protein
MTTAPQRVPGDVLIHLVEFLQKPEDRPYGVGALCRDNSGTWIVLVEPKDFSS